MTPIEFIQSLEKTCENCGGKGTVDVEEYDYLARGKKTQIRQTRCDNCLWEGIVLTEAGHLFLQFLERQLKFNDGKGPLGQIFKEAMKRALDRD